MIKLLKKAVLSILLYLVGMPLIAQVVLVPEIQTGADNSKLYLTLLAGKKVGIVTNQTGVLSNGTHLVDFLLKNKIKIKSIFAPEHGFRGTADAGEHFNDEIDKKTGLPIISLYGNNRKPTPIQLKGIDVIVFDLQDVGARFYTYIGTLHYIMEACTENKKMLVLLDRPNPKGGSIDGPILEAPFTSFVGMHPKVPILHGMTLGEYAQMINGEQWIKKRLHCNLIIIPCTNYTKDMAYSLRVRPSPNLPNDQSINLYPSLCLFEGTNVSVGRGTNKQFQEYGSPFLEKSEFYFVPKPNFGDKNPMHNGLKCYGEDLSSEKKTNGLELKWLIKAYQSTKDKDLFFNKFFTKLAGTENLQKQIEAGISEEEIRNSWQEGLNNFYKIREKYLIYK